MRRLWLLAALLTATAFSSSNVRAHAELVSAFPEPGSTVARLTEIRLTFSEPIAANGTILLHQEFVSAAELRPQIDPNDATELAAAVPPLPDGVYTVQWSVKSADGHPVSGSYSLGIQSGLDRSNTPWYLRPWVLAGLVAGSLAAATFILRRGQPAAYL